MRDRHIFWDLATVGLLGTLVIICLVILIQNERGWKWLIEQDERSKEIAAQNREILNRLDGGLTIKNMPQMTLAPEATAQTSTGTATNSSVATNTDTTPIKPVSGKLFDGHDLPKFVRGDENATDGDWLVLNEGSEPNSLNPMIDNDATASDLFGRANDDLVERCFDDFKYWKPKLARAWEKSMVCRGIAAKHNAKELAEKLNGAWDEAKKTSLGVVKIQAESDEILRIDLADVDNRYRDEVAKTLGADAISPQYWIYVNFEGEKFADGAEITGENVGARLKKAIEANAKFKGALLDPWSRDSSVVMIVTGNGDEAQAAIKEFVDGPANSGEITDPKAASGKRTGKVLTLDLREDYLFEEKPVFTFHLRKDVRWHDGIPFTGKDIIFSFNTVMNPKVEAAPARNYMQDCQSCTLVNGDPYVVQFVWKKPYFMAFNISAGVTILPEHIFKFTDPDQFNKGPQNQKLIGTGPYKLESWERKKQFVFVRNEDYWDKKPHFSKIVYKLVDDRTVALKMLQTGDLDVQSLTKAQAKQYTNDLEFLKKWPINVSVANVYRYIGWNERKPMFDSAKVRRALTMLIDRKRVVEDIYRGFALTMNGPAHPDSPVYTTEINKYAVPYDPKQAAALLAEEGWTKGSDGVLYKNGEPFKFTLLFVSGSPEYESVANLVKDSFAQVGIVVNTSNLEWSVLLQKVDRHEFDSVILGWRLGLEDDPYQLWHSSQTVEKGSNHCNFKNTEVDRLIEEGRRELNDEKRTKMFQRVNEIIAEQQPYTFLLVEKRTAAYDHRLENVVYKLTGADTTRWWVPTGQQKYK